MLSSHFFSIFLLCLFNDSSFNFVDGDCVFDEIKLISPRRQHVAYKHTSHVIAKRSDSHNPYSWYRPIRIHVHYGNTKEELMPEEEEKLKSVLQFTVKKLTEIFSVIPVEGPLLLHRDVDACGSEWQTGPNKGKCASLRRAYKGETCLDNFQIPDSHIEAIAIWNSTHPDPIKEYESGDGIPDTDYVLYVQSITTSVCAKQGLNILAYASYCHLDQNDRPVAGYVNFCPALLRSQTLDRLQQTALHELFHALGFSNELMYKFKQCSITDGKLSCQPRKRPIRNVLGSPRLVTPKVVELTSEHFDCRTHDTLNEFGSMLETKNDTVKSHWDAAFMFSSIMTPTVATSHLSVLDPITLAAFEDSGWYKVNYSVAQHFWWGQGAGCEFGSFPACQQQSKFFCLGSRTGCHYMHKDKATCSTSVFLKGCQVFQAKLKDSCLHLPVNSAKHDDETFSASSGCFMSNVTQLLDGDTIEPTAKCYLYQCNTTRHLHVKVDDTTWYYCPTQSYIQIDGYGGVIECPDNRVLCGEIRQHKDSRVSYVTKVVTTTTTTTSVEVSSTRFAYKPLTLSTLSADDQTVTVWITFSDMDYGLVHSGMGFSELVITAVIYATDVHRRRLTNVKMTHESAIVQFDLLPPMYSDDGPASLHIINQLQLLVYSQNLTVTIPSSNVTYIATYIRIEPGGPQVAHNKLPLVAVLFIVFGSLIVASIFGLLVFMVQRHYAVQHSRISPSRRGNNVAPLDVTDNEDSPVRDAVVSYTHGRTSQDMVEPSDIVIVAR